VASDGEDAGSTSGAGAGGQTADGSTGAGQIASPSVNAPVRVASDGDDGTTATQSQDAGDTGALGGPEDLDGDTGAAGGPVDVTGDGGFGGDGSATNEDGSGGVSVTPIAAVLGAKAGSLPYSGLGLALMFAIGGLLLASGIAIRRGRGAIE
jgi:hypothetical protein